MNRPTVVRAGLLTSTCVLAAVTAASLATFAAADTSPLTVSGGVAVAGGTTAYCANSTYSLNVRAADIPAGTTQFEFLDGSNVATATTIGSLQTAQAGQDATVSWTPTTSGTHDLWLLAMGTGGTTALVGPSAVSVLDQTSTTCTAPAAQAPAGLQDLLNSLNLGQLGSLISPLVSSLSAQ